MTRRRILSSSEKALWDKIARTVVPLRPEPPPPSVTLPVPPKASPPAEAPKPAQPPAEPPPAAPAPPPAIKARPASDLDRKTRRKLARGALGIDARIDLHGMTQEEAHGALSRFIVASVGQRRRVVLVITGKGLGEGEGRGVLRRSVPHWLAGRDLARHIVTFGPANPTHGGDGALYVRLRSPKR